MKMKLVIPILLFVLVAVFLFYKERNAMTGMEIYTSKISLEEQKPLALNLSTNNYAGNGSLKHSIKGNYSIELIINGGIDVKTHKQLISSRTNYEKADSIKYAILSEFQKNNVNLDIVMHINEQKKVSFDNLKPITVKELHDGSISIYYKNYNVPNDVPLNEVLDVNYKLNNFTKKLQQQYTDLVLQVEVIGVL